MKRILHYLVALIVLSAAFLSCQKNPEEAVTSDEGISKVIMRLSPFEGDDVETRTEYSFDSGTNTFTFLWAEGEHTGFLYCGSLGNLVLAVINVPASLLGGFLATLLRIGLLHCNCLFLCHNW